MKSILSSMVRGVAGCQRDSTLRTVIPGFTPTGLRANIEIPIAYLLWFMYNPFFFGRVEMLDLVMPFCGARWGPEYA